MADRGRGQINTSAIIPQTRRERLEVLRAQLITERSSFETHWRDLGEYVLPRRIRFQTTDTNRGEKRNTRIVDSTATLASRTLRAGMMSGITSPARPWFRLTTPDPDLSEFGPVKQWLDTITKRMLSIFLRSNLYKSLPLVYGDLGTFGTGCVFIEPDADTVIHTQSFPIASYSISTDRKGQVRTFFREFRMTVKQLVEKFGRTNRAGGVIWDNFTDTVRHSFETGQLETWIDVCHYVGNNEFFDTNRSESKFKKWASVYFERGFTTRGGSFTANRENVLLRESGFDIYPVLAPRWEVTGQDVYGTECPGMVALGDIKQLQLGERRTLQAVDKMINPPMTGPAALQNRKASILPGDITYLDVREGQQGFKPAHDVNFNIQQMELKQAQVRQRISRAYYEDLFLMLQNTDRRQITATEIDERVQEKLLALGPVLEQLNQDLLDPLIDNTFQSMLNLDQVPEPPDEIQGTELKVEYISIMAQAQKLVGISAIERFSGFVTGLSQFKPDVLDKINMDQVADVFGDRMSVDPDIIRSDEEVKAIRDNRQQAIELQQEAELAKTGSETAKTLSETKLEEGTALAALPEALA